jgi:preprotein translocase subunit YajC
VEASRGRVSESGLKTDGVVTTGGARGTITEVASMSS